MKQLIDPRYRCLPNLMNTKRGCKNRSSRRVLRSQRNCLLNQVRIVQRLVVRWLRPHQI